MTLLDSQEIKNRIDWKDLSKRITKTYSFVNFKEALIFVNKVGKLAESQNHHPDIHIHDYKKVTIYLSTHSEGGVTEKDINLAEQIDSLK
jgi:4a-hydroxytetrahydrobiopterin dehydratase